METITLLLRSPYWWVIEIALLITSLIAINFLAKWLLKKILCHAYAEKECKEALKVFYLPLKVLFIVLGTFYSVEIVFSHFNYPGLAQNLKMVRTASISFIFMWLLLRWKKDFFQRLSERQVGAKRMGERSLFQIFDRTLTITIIILTLLIILSVFGLNIAPLITFGGVGAAAVGFAAKDVIGNFFGGMMLFITRPFNLHDYIQLPAHKIEGSVEEIGWYHTSIRDKDKKEIYVPNSLFASGMLVNSSRRTHRKIELIFPLTLSSLEKVQPILDAAKAHIRQSPLLDHHAPFQVYCSKLRDGVLEIAFHAYSVQVKEEDFLELQSDIIQYICQEIKEKGGKLATGPCFAAQD